MRGENSLSTIRDDITPMRHQRCCSGKSTDRLNGEGVEGHSSVERFVEQHQVLLQAEDRDSGAVLRVMRWIGTVQAINLAVNDERPPLAGRPFVLKIVRRRPTLPHPP